MIAVVADRRATLSATSSFVEPRKTHDPAEEDAYLVRVLFCG